MKNNSFFIKADDEEKERINKVKDDFNLTLRDFFFYGEKHLEEYKRKCLLDLRIKGYFNAYVKLTHRIYRDKENNLVKEFSIYQINMFEPVTKPMSESEVLPIKIHALSPHYKGKSIKLKYSYKHAGRERTLTTSVNRKRSDGAISWIMENQ